LTGGYLFSNPNAFNGFEKKFGGMWNVGVVLKVPIVTWGDRIYKVKQAKVEAQMARTQAEEVREKISLQVNQNRQKLQEAQHRLATAIRSQEQADENLRMANLGMKEGVIPVSNVLQAQTAWLSAHSTLADAEIDVRLADLYLLYAEAINEAEGPNGPNSAEMFKYINLVRERAGIPSVQESWDEYSNAPGFYKSQLGMREIIQRERLNELAFEGQRFWDLRRWKTAPAEYAKGIYGWNSAKMSNRALYYKKVEIYDVPPFRVRDYFWPIATSDIDVNPNLVQNLGW
jgi:hypothetical protein